MFVRLFREVYDHRELLWALTGRDIRVKYKQAVMGVLWVFFMPVVGIASGIIVRVGMAAMRGGGMSTEQVAQVMIRMLLWLFFAMAVGASSASLVGHMDLVTKIYFPRQILPISNLLSRLLDFAISAVGVAAALIIMAVVSTASQPLVVLSWNLLWVPFLVFVLLLLTVGLGLILSAANLFFRDVRYLVEVFLRFGIFFTPVFLFVKDLWPNPLAEWAMLNPVAGILEGITAALFTGQVSVATGTEMPLLPWILYSVVLSFGVFFVACTVFERVESRFAEFV